MMYPGNIIDNAFVFEELIYLDSHDKKKLFRMFVRLVKKKVDRQANWNVLQDDVVHLKPEYLDGVELPICHAQYWSEYGRIDGKITRSSPKYPKPKHVGSKNQRNILIQAMFEANALYQKKKNETRSGTNEEQRAAYVYPMLSTDKGTYSYPVFAQPKLNGQRCICYKKDNEVVMYTRGLKEWPKSPSLKLIADELLGIDFGDLYLDGELYVHGLPLEELGQMRSEKYSGPAEYHIFDCFRLNDKSDFSQRYKQLSLLTLSEHVKLVETVVISDEKEEEKYLKSRLKQNYEGIMIRIMEGTYKYSINKVAVRSKFVIKRKPLFDAEFEVVGYTHGTGKDANAVIWICRTENNKLFNVTPKLTYKERQELFRECEDNFDKYRNRMLKVEFRELSKLMVPLRAKAIGFRDFE